MSDQPVKAAAFGTVLEAQVFVNRLELEEIPAHIVDGEAGTTLGYLGAAIGGIKVYVLPRDFERAQQILGEMHGESEWGEAFADDEEWPCPACGAAVPGEHEVCWSCGTERRGDAAAVFEPVEASERTVGEDASEIVTPSQKHALGAEAAAEVGRRRSRWTFLLMLTGPIGLICLAVAALLNDDAAPGAHAQGERADAMRRDPREGQWEDVRIGLYASAFMLVGLLVYLAIHYDVLF